MSFQKILKEDLTNESYHNRPNSLSSSGLKDLAICVDAWKFNKANRKESKAMDTGSYFHKWVLEPESYKPMVLPKVSMASKGCDPDKPKGVIDLLMFLDEQESFDEAYSIENYKQIKISQLKEIAETKIKFFKDAGFDLIDEKTFKEVESMKAGIKQHELLNLEGAGLLSLDNTDCETETSFFVPLQALEGFKDCELELELRIRPDYFIGGEYIADLKSTLTANPKRFKYEVLKWGYHVSAAFYLDVYNAYMKWFHRDRIDFLVSCIGRLQNETFLTSELTEAREELESFFIREFKIIACENTGSGICTNFELSQELIQEGREIYQRGLQNYIDYQKGFVYGGYSQEIVTL